MTELRFALLNAAFNGERSSRNFKRDLPVPVVEFDVNDGDLPTTFDFDAAVVTGSGASAYWDDDWIDDLRGWLVEADERNFPLLGVCFGHQILADALGGTVRDMGEYEIGYREIEHTGESVLFEGIDRRFLAFTTHHDEVTALPPGAANLAVNDYSNHGFRRGHAFGVQFHPEFDLETAKHATENKDLPDERLEAVLAGIHEENHEAAQQAKRVFENFGRYVARHRGVTRAADD